MDHERMFTAAKIAHRLELIRQNLYLRSHALPPFGYLGLQGPQDTSWRDVRPGGARLEKVGPHGYWGSWETDFALVGSCMMPADWPADVPCALHLPLGRSGDFLCHPEALVHLGGEAIGSADRHHQLVFLPQDAPRGVELPLVVRGWTGLADWPPDPGVKTQPYMRPAMVVQRHEKGFEFVCLAECALETAKLDTTDAAARSGLLDVLDAAFLQLDLTDPLPHEDYFRSLEKALDKLKKGLATGRAGRPQDAAIHAVGHAHIDVAYLWVQAQTRAKARRTFTNALALMDRHEEFRFTQTTPLLYRFCQEDDPGLLDRIRRRVDDGRWEATGGMWVEPDCHLIGAESLVRQLMLGRSLYDETLAGKDSRILFLPDSFGFCASLPQLIEQAGLSGFVFSKLNWNQTNRFPHSFFWWRGLDGTRVFSHLITTPRDETYLPMISTYKAEMSAWEVSQSVVRNRQHDVGMPSMIAYGYGDGGGGPTDGQVRRADAFKAMPGQPRLCFGRLDTFLDQARDSAPSDLPVHDGELYLELHRGTYTSQAKIKRANRRLEAAFARTEFLACAATMGDKSAYPHDSLRDAWETLCTNQFHDILPGTAITPAIDQAMEGYERIGRQLDKTDRQSLSALSTDGAKGQAWAVLNASPVGGRFDVEIRDCHGKVATGPDGAALSCQQTSGGLLVRLDDLDGWSLTSLTLEDGESAAAPSDLRCEQKADGWIMENHLVRVEVDGDGNLAGLWDKVRGSLLAGGQAANQLVAYEDRPIGWDSWDIDPFYEEKREQIAGATKVELVENGPLRASVLVERTWRSSTITQHIRLYAGSARIDFDTRVDWRESHVLLKAAFPVAIDADTARHHVPFGFVKRPTGRKTPEDWAMYEVPTHYWACVADGKRGIALLNDCKYGHDISQRPEGTLMRLTLIKSGTLPDPTADQGLHEFGYSLLPFGPENPAQVMAEGYRINRAPMPVRLPEGAGLAPWSLPVKVGGTLLLETVKWAEDGSGAVLRFYEATGRAGTQGIHFSKEPASVRRVTILEGDGDVLEPKDGTLEVNCRAFEVMTLVVDWG